MEKYAYKIENAQIWHAAMARGIYEGSALDVKDGFIHLSTAKQAGKTLALYFASQKDLIIAKIDLDLLADKVVWEKSRGGDLFPHIYGNLPKIAVKACQNIISGPDETLQLPDLDRETI